MRERANKIEQSKEQLRMYEASSSSNLISTRDEEDSRQQSSSPTIPAANNRNVGCWVPLYETTLPVGANEEWCQLSLLGNSAQLRARASLARSHEAAVSKQFWRDTAATGALGASRQPNNYYKGSITYTKSYDRR